MIINLRRFSKDNLIQFIKGFFTDKLLIAAVFIFLLKAVLFLSIISTLGASSIDLDTGIGRISFFSVYISFITALLSFCFLFKGRGRFIFLLAADFIYTVLLIGDLWYYRGFGAFLSLQLIKMTANADNMGDSILSMWRPVDMLLTIDLVVFIAAAFLLRSKYKNIKRSVLHFSVTLLLSVLFLVYMHDKVDIRHATKTYQYLFNMRYNPDMTVSNLSPLGYHYYDAYTFAEDSSEYKLTEEDYKEIQTYYEGKVENLPDNKYASIFKGKNVIALQVESLENFVIGQSVEGQEITPNLNKLLKNSLYFSNYYEQVNGGTSSDSDLMVNTSVYPVRSGSTFFRYPENSYNSLPLLFKAEGYGTLAIHPDKGSFWNWMPALSSIGFEKCIDSSKFEHDEEIDLGLSDGSYLRQVEPILAAEKQPFYTFMVTLTSHSPFDLPDKYRELKLNKNLDTSRLGGYFQSIHYTDKQIGLFVDKLNSDGILKNTVVLIFGDHTGIHKYYQDEVNKMDAAEKWWLDDEKKIPLLIYNPSEQGEEIKIKGGPIDLFPTLCYLMGIEKSKYQNTAMGRNLLNTKKDFVVLSDGKYIGSAQSDKERKISIEALDIADKLVRSNYFKNRLSQ